MLISNFDSFGKEHKDILKSENVCNMKPIMLMKKSLLIGSLVVLFGCGSKELKTLENPLIIGAATPIQLDQQVTNVILEDYVLKPERIDSITTDGPFNLEIDNSILRIVGRSKQPIYNLTFLVWRNR